MKKFLCILIVCFSIVLLPGCAQIEYLISISADGAVTIAAAASVDIKAIETAHEKNENSANIESVKVVMKTLFEEYANQLTTTLSGKVNLEVKNEEQTENNIYSRLITVKYKSLADYTLANEILSGKSKFSVSETLVSKDNLANNNIKQNNAKAGTIENVNWFLKRQILLNVKNAFYTNMDLINKVENAFKILHLDSFSVDKDVVFYQTIVYPNRRVKSNATQVVKTSNSTAHIYAMTKPEMENADVVLYINYPRPAAWYLIALGITVVFISGFSAWWFIKHKKVIHNK